jgi:shikimate kinase
VYPHAQGRGFYGAFDKICEVLFEGVLMTDRKDFDVVICDRDWQA